jgi:phosphoglycolate phosphatase
MPRAILFDLDGTLVDTRAASWELFSETNLAFALGIDSREAFFRAFEGNFFESLARLCPDAERAAAAKTHFMELLRTRYSPPLIPGMVDVVRALAPHCTLAVISTNGLEAIRRILVEAGIATCFSHVFSGDVEPRKSVSIRRFLGDHRYAAQRLCSPAYHDVQQSNVALAADDVVLVTDTVGDVIEAREAGVCAVGVAWGMHTERQLKEAGAARVALWPQELVAWLRGSEQNAIACACDTSVAPVPALAAPSIGAPASPPPLGAPVIAASPLHALPGLIGAKPSTLTPTTDPEIEAGRLRRERQLQLRQLQLTQVQSAVLAGVRTSTSASAEPARQYASAAAQSELLHALKRIVGSSP